MLELTNLRKSYGPLTILDGVSLTVAEGEVVALIGRSGCGKSTLLRCINFLEDYDDGEIRLDGRRLWHREGSRSSLPRRDIERDRQRIGVVFQQYNLFPHMTALENVCLGPVHGMGVSRAEAEATGRRMLERVGLGERADFYPSQLSGGQMQRVAIARALAMKSRLLLLDEATSALDPELVAEVEDVIKALRAEGMAMVMVTHSMALAREAADRIAYMKGGRIVEIAPAAQLLDAPQAPGLRDFLKRIR
ncbi:amino acid ABC transporter ATP-binding protein [Frigidibacter sp. MR17.14]|uniref:amino acid ABC transporter ATP-binding protein n=1 Tax=Frigidibacter sp. MR17.14 TaxID=3126509 RepID=UPI00301306EF